MSASILVQKFLAMTLPPIPPRYHRPIQLGLMVILGVALAWLPLKTAGLATAGAIFLSLALLEPTLILLALIPIIPFSSLVALPLGEARAGAMELLLLLGIATWLLKIFTGQSVRGVPLKIHSGPLLVPFVVFLGAAGLTWLNTLSIRASLIETVKWVEMFGLYLLIINLLPARRIKWVVLIILLTGMAQAGLGLYQFIFKVGPDGFLLFGGEFLRAYGTFAQPNPYAGYLGLILPLALSIALWSVESMPDIHTRRFVHHASPRWNTLLRGGYLAARTALFSLPLALMLAALFASQSRGAWLGFAGGALVTVLVRSKKLAMLFGVAVLLAGGLFVLGSLNITATRSDSGSNTLQTLVTQRFVDAAQIFEITDVAISPVTDATFATVERLAHWQAARDMWRDNPWLGVGFGNYAAIYPAYAVGRWLDPLGHAHNYLLNLGAETGLVGIISYLIFWIWVFGLSFLAVSNSNGFFKAAAAGGLGVFTHLQIHNMVDNLYVQGMYLHVAIIIGLVAVIYLSNQTTPPENAARG
jgi:O-antigen ligase